MPLAMTGGLLHTMDDAVEGSQSTQGDPDAAGRTESFCDGLCDGPDASGASDPRGLSEGLAEARDPRTEPPRLPSGQPLPGGGSLSSRDRSTDESPDRGEGLVMGNADRCRGRGLRGRRPELVFAVLTGWIAVGVACGLPSERADGSGETDGGDAVELAAADRPDGAASIGPGGAKRLYFQYLDDTGAVRFTERLEEVPEAWRDRVGSVELDGPPPLTPGDAQRARAKRFASSAAGQARRSRIRDLAAQVPERRAPKVVLFYAEWCPYCRKAKRHLERRGIDFDLRDIDRPENSAELRRRTGQKSVPVIEVDGRVLMGYDASRLDKLLDAMG